MSYANPGYTVAAYVIEKVAGEPYEDYLARESCDPLGMTGGAASLDGRRPTGDSRAGTTAGASAIPVPGDPSPSGRGNLVWRRRASWRPW